MNRVAEIIEQLELLPHPEGGYYKEVYRSEMEVQSPVHGLQRNSLTHIYFLLGKGQFSRFHMVSHDEVWNFYEGEPLVLILFDGETVQELELGSGCSDGYTAVVPAGVWQAAYSTGDYSLVGCSVAPGFDFEDFQFMENEQNIQCLSSQFPHLKTYI